MISNEDLKKILQDQVKTNTEITEAEAQKEVKIASQIAEDNIDKAKAQDKLQAQLEAVIQNDKNGSGYIQSELIIGAMNSVHDNSKVESFDEELAFNSITPKKPINK